MKNNLISAIAGWKSAALLALVAMVAAVAFSGVLTSTQTTQAQAPTTPGGQGAVPYNAPAGTTVTVTFASVGTDDRYRISEDSEGSATFANGSTNLTCADWDSTDAATLLNQACDSNGTDNTVTFTVTIDADSPLGSIWIQNYARQPGGADPTIAAANEVEIKVVRSNPPVAMHVLAPHASAIPSTGGTTTITIQLVDGRGNGLVGQRLAVSTTRGLLVATNDNVPDATDNACEATDAVSVCTVQTRAAAGADTPNDPADDVAAGQVAVTLNSNQGTGNAAVTFRHASGLTRTFDITVHGPAASISAVAEEKTIGVGNDTYIVVTVLDADGNPTVGSQADVATSVPLANPIAPPEVPAGTQAVRITANNDLDRGHPVPALNLPACGDQPNTDADTTDDVDPSAGNIMANAGTNTSGKCVIKITAPGAGTPANPADDATRGTHTVTVSVVNTAGTPNARIEAATVEIQVGGAPATIEHDAGSSIEPSDEITVNVTVLDDEGGRVGSVPIEVIQTAGDGSIITGAATRTSDGRAKFTYLAPSTPGTVEFLVRTRAAVSDEGVFSGPTTAKQAIIIAIGDAPAAESATWNNDLVSGQNLVVWNGEDGADPSAGAADGVTAIWSYN
ncbi:MAG: hypothetical protein OXH12_01970, partial [Chloroflexi bacterium]|nr:hypothetical protein [Chloroflexota bacterium]